MSKYIILFMVMFLVATFAGPAIYTAGGTTTLHVLGMITTFGGSLLTLWFGILATKTANISKKRKIIVYVLVVVAAIAGLLAGSTEFRF